MTQSSSNSTSQTHSFKIVLLGEGAVGKTSLALRFVKDSFPENHNATIQASFLQKRIHLDNTRIELNVWDTAGQERFHALSPIYYRDADGALIIFDITDSDSFQRLKKWISELRSLLGDELPIVIVANKFDLNSRRVIKREELKDYVKSIVAEEKDKEKDCEITSELLNGLSHNSSTDDKTGLRNVLWIECSAKSGMGVENAFLGLSYMMLQRRRIKTGSKSLSKTSNKSNRELNLKKGSVSRSASRRNIVVLNQDDDSNTEAQRDGRTKKKCCLIQ